MGIGTNRLGTSPPMYKHVQRDKPVCSELLINKKKKKIFVIFLTFSGIWYKSKIGARI